MGRRKERRAACIEAAKHRHPSARRTLHLVDVDNLLGDPSTVSRRKIDRTFATYRVAADFRFGDHVVVATHPHGMHAAVVRLAWPGVCHRWKGGRDGADLVLLEEATEAARSRRYERVVIGSGDRIFLEAMDRLRARDVVVDVVGRRRSMATALAVRAGTVTYLDDHRPPKAA